MVSILGIRFILFLFLLFPSFPVIYHFLAQMNLTIYILDLFVSFTSIVFESICINRKLSNFSILDWRILVDKNWKTLLHWVMERCQPHHSHMLQICCSREVKITWTQSKFSSLSNSNQVKNCGMPIDSALETLCCFSLDESSVLHLLQTHLCSSTRCTGYIHLCTALWLQVKIWLMFFYMTIWQLLQ